jgi:predicted CXXCH cytochrome family protein
VRLAPLLAIAAACGRPAATAPTKPQELTSNVLRADYAGSSACADCHGAIYAAWAASPMRNMTRDAKTTAIRAPFDGQALRVGPDVVTMEAAGGERFMTLVQPSETHRFRVTKVIGGRVREDFVGAEADGVEHVLPATYVFSSKSWRYKGYSVMVVERPKMAWKEQWSKTCIGCHNTLPLATMLYDELYGPKLPPYQGKLADRVLPKSKQWPAHALDEPGLSRALADEIRFLGAEPPDERSLGVMLPAAAIAMENRLDGAHLVELGIGCEACHNGAREHAADPKILPSFEAKSPVFDVDPPSGQSGTRAQWINHTCSKCHTVLFTRYPWTWEGGKRNDKQPGGSSISSGEGRDYQLGGCATQMACTTCHDPHAQDSTEKLRALGNPEGNHVCTTCHNVTQDHSHHAPGSAGSACIACHMAKKNMGLDYVLNRYHRIGSPNALVRVERDRPLECALCHHDKSVEQIVQAMEQWWGKRYDRAKLRALYGDDLAVNAIRATLERGKPHEQAVAIAVLGDARDRSAVSALAPMLAHEYPLVRYFAQRALQNITGDPVAIDVGAAAADVRRAADAWLTAAAARP